MESTDQPPSAPEDSDRLGDEQSGHNSPSPARSYECVFCKRGFSNAQALGGHMNIHRKDKAKLKQLAGGTTSGLSPSSEPQLGFNQPVDIPRTLPSLYYPPNVNIPSVSMGGSKIDNPEAGKLYTWPRFLHQQEEIRADLNVKHREEISKDRKAVHLEGRQVPVSKSDQELDTRSILPDDEAKGGDRSLIHGDSGSIEVDLELRLGSSPTKGTKKFF